MAIGLAKKAGVHSDAPKMIPRAEGEDTQPCLPELMNTQPCTPEVELLRRLATEKRQQAVALVRQSGSTQMAVQMVRVAKVFEQRAELLEALSNQTHDVVNMKRSRRPSRDCVDCMPTVNEASCATYGG